MFLIITILHIYYTAWYSMASSENYVWRSFRVAFKNVAKGTQGRYSQYFKHSIRSNKEFWYGTIKRKQTIE